MISERPDRARQFDTTSAKSRTTGDPSGTATRPITHPQSCWCTFLCANLDPLVTMLRYLGIPIEDVQPALLSALDDLNSGQKSPQSSEFPLGKALLRIMLQAQPTRHYNRLTAGDREEISLGESG